MSRALLFVSPSERIDGRYAPALLPLVDRPLLQHAVERLVLAGVESIDLLIGALVNAPVEALLGDGSRWGVRIAYQLAADSAEMLAVARGVLRAMPPTDCIWLARGDVLPAPLIDPAAGPADPFAVYDGVSGIWTGWARLPAETAAGVLAATDGGPEDLEAALRADTTIAAHAAAVVLSAVTLRALLASQRALLDDSQPGLLRTGREVEPGVHLSRNVALHHSARIVPPVFIGQDCRIGAGAEVGPYAVIGDRCIVDEGATVAHSLILSGSYIGEETEVCEAVVDRNRLMSVRFGATVELLDRFLLGDLNAPLGAGAVLGAFCERLAALALLLLFWPLLLLTALWRVGSLGAIVYRQAVVRLPVGDEDNAPLPTVPLYSFTLQPDTVEGGAHFFLVFLPGLFSVLRGGVHFVGVPGRTAAAVATLTPDWRALYLRSRVGLITERFVTFGPLADRDEQYSADAFYTVTSGFRHNAGLILRYLARVVAPRIGQRAEAGTRV